MCAQCKPIKKKAVVIDSKVQVITVFAPVYDPTLKQTMRHARSVTQSIMGRPSLDRYDRSHV